MQSKYDNYAQGGSSQSYDNTQLKPTANNTIEGDLVRAFGSSSRYGDSLGVVFEDAVLTDGGLYLDPEKGIYKTFSWKEMTGYSIPESVENGDEPAADDAPEVLPKTYGDTQKRYELVAAIVPELTDEDGEVVVEGSSKTRNFELVKEDGEIAGVEWGEFEDLDGEPVPFGDIIMWHGASEENGPSAASLRLAEMLTTVGDQATNEDADAYNWLNLPDGENLIRGELEGRRVRFFIVRRESQESGRMYNFPVLEDVKTGEPIERNHSDSGSESGN